MLLYCRGLTYPCFILTPISDSFSPGSCCGWRHRHCNIRVGVVAAVIYLFEAVVVLVIYSLQSFRSRPVCGVLVGLVPFVYSPSRVRVGKRTALVR